MVATATRKDFSGRVPPARRVRIEKPAAAPAPFEGLRVQVLAENLHRAVCQLKRFTAFRTVNRQTGNFLLTADNGRLRVEATNLDAHAQVWVGARVDHEGAVSVNAAQLARFVATLSESCLTITGGQVERQLRAGGETVVTLDPVVTVEAEGAILTLAGANPGEWPSLAADDEATSHELPKGWQDALRVAMPCTALDDSRPVLTSVRFEGKEGRLRLAAADGFRLAVVDAGPYAGEPFAASVCQPGLRRLLQLRVPADEPMTLKLQANRATFETDDVDVTCTLVAGTYPNFEQLIPKEWTTRVTAPAEALWRTLQRAGVVAEEGSGIIRLEATPGGLTVSAKAADFGSYEQRLVAAVEGVAGGIAFNVRYLQETIAWRSGDVAIEFKGRSDPGMFYPPGREERVVIMPMFVQW